MGNCLSNCITSTVLSVLLCKHGCKIENVAKTLAYFPPSPPTYKLVPLENEKFQIQLVDPQLCAWGDCLRAAHKAEGHMLTTARGARIPAVMFRSHPPSTTTILFSHSNAMDLGIVLDLLHKLCLLLKVNVFAYEYSGYGVSVGKGPSEEDTYADITAAFDKLGNLGIGPSHVILYGQSIGSGPSCWLASVRPVSGLILHGPLASALDVVSRPGFCRPSFLFACCNMYPNVDRVRRVTCPTLVMHGHADEVVAFSNGKRLHEATRGTAKYPPYWVPGAGHNNLLEADPEGYLRVLREFIAHAQAQA
eukprot:c2943_g1_i1.p1 GENE.c2943_g1_i1~~c2943_g1_i1.p1  ORF type:complete len:306 (+),score=36.40 c2943_g1_i1:33-950(+)